MARDVQLLVDARRGRVLASRLERAHTFASRLKGLLLRSEFPAGAGLWLSPCRAIHTFGMRFPIDALFLDARLRVVAVRERIAPWRLVRPVARSTSVVELPAGTVGVTRASVGDELSVEPVKAGGF